MMNSVKKSMYVLGFAALAALSACGGGGGDAGTPPFGGGNPTDPTQPVAADLVLNLDKVEMKNSGADAVTLTITAVDAKRQTVSGAPMAVQADGDAIVSSTSTSTDATGKFVATIGPGNNKANRVVTLTALSGSVSKSITVTVTGGKLTTSAPASVAAGAADKVTFRLVDSNAAAVAGQAVQIIAPLLTPSTATGVTDGNGQYIYNFTVPASASGTAEITATAGGVSVNQIIQVAGTVTTPDVTEAILSASVEANPSVVGVNSAASNANRSEIRALFLGANNKPIPNVRVTFDLAGDANSVGGTFGSTTPVLSNLNGVATTSYTPGTRSSPLEGVTIRACYGATDAEVLTCTRSTTTKLTVSSEPLGVTIGTNNIVGIQTLTYTKQYVVTVVDASGQPMAGVDVVAFIKLEQFRKGYYDFYAAGTNTTAGWRPTVLQTCPAEDKNGNGVLEAGDDDDGDGRLEPRPSDVSVKMLQSKTGADGTAQLEIQYAQNFATWINAKITVSATGIGGTEGRDSILVVPLPAPNTAFQNSTVAPAFTVSPYGQVVGAGSCANPN